MTGQPHGVREGRISHFTELLAITARREACPAPPDLDLQVWFDRYEHQVLDKRITGGRVDGVANLGAVESELQNVSAALCSHRRVCGCPVLARSSAKEPLFERCTPQQHRVRRRLLCHRAPNVRLLGVSKEDDQTEGRERLSPDSLDHVVGAGPDPRVRRVDDRSEADVHGSNELWGKARVADENSRRGKPTQYASGSDHGLVVRHRSRFDQNR